MKKTFLLLLLVSCIACKQYENQRDCDDFRTGTFVWEQESGGKLLKTTFVRTEDMQIETFEGVTDTSRVEWVNECEWRIIPVNPKTNADSRAYLFKILNTTANSYTFEFTQSGRDEIYRGEARKVE
ncbi:DNA topoisomerase IV [Nonlabens ponticola]|uniref:DNA topoisomerase IV n=1 Tax=Nonlabens ponticola TaxID=2496866 RepID=A0A3S9MYD4_9FLAO|nr:DNA topoisomerase IV [Nonlabens ponticola]AZQ44167.1 DNA topoisomerase IV [Nonlabens ponticola]